MLRILVEKGEEEDGRRVRRRRKHLKLNTFRTQGYVYLLESQFQIPTLGYHIQVYKMVFPYL